MSKETCSYQELKAERENIRNQINKMEERLFEVDCAITEKRNPQYKINDLVLWVNTDDKTLLCCVENIEPAPEEYRYRIRTHVTYWNKDENKRWRYLFVYESDIHEATGWAREDLIPKTHRQKVPGQGSRGSRSCARKHRLPAQPVSTDMINFILST